MLKKFLIQSAEKKYNIVLLANHPQMAKGENDNERQY